MLTGDLGHTAKEIAFNCGVMSRDDRVNSIFTLEAIDSNELKQHILDASEGIKQSKSEYKKTTVMVSG